MYIATKYLRRGSVALAVCAGLAGCGSITGIQGAQSSQSCAMIGGTACLSMDEAYRRSLDPDDASGTPAVKRRADKDADPPGPSPYPHRTSTLQAPAAGTPLRSPTVELRIWLAPWEDRDGALHDQQYVYLVVDPGRWMVDAYRAKAGEQFRPVRVPVPDPAASAAPAAGHTAITAGDAPARGAADLLRNIAGRADQ
ncbi:MAG: TraV family lipoprotein [Rhodocyclaceae bacterium]|nr:TraV family lipoprotein [Rhodocyclaceae bacterium]